MVERQETAQDILELVSEHGWNFFTYSRKKSSSNGHPENDESAKSDEIFIGLSSGCEDIGYLSRQGFTSEFPFVEDNFLVNDIITSSHVSCKDAVKDILLRGDIEVFKVLVLAGIIDNAFLRDLMKEEKKRRVFTPESVSFLIEKGFAPLDPGIASCLTEEGYGAFVVRNFEKFSSIDIQSIMRMVKDLYEAVGLDSEK